MSDQINKWFQSIEKKDVPVFYVFSLVWPRNPLGIRVELTFSHMSGTRVMLVVELTGSYKITKPLTFLSLAAKQSFQKRPNLMQSFLMGMLFLQLQQTRRILKARFEAKKLRGRNAVLVTPANLSTYFQAEFSSKVFWRKHCSCNTSESFSKFLKPNSKANIGLP